MPWAGFGTALLLASGSAAIQTTCNMDVICRRGEHGGRSCRSFALQPSFLAKRFVSFAIDFQVGCRYRRCIGKGGLIYWR